MVKTRRTGDAKEFKPYYDEMISRFGGSFTLERDEVEMDSLGCVLSATTTSSTITGDFQRITDTKELNLLGLTGEGNARFYTGSTTNIQPGDILVVNSERWEFKTRTEDDDFVNSEVAEVWTLVRIDG